MKNKKVIGLLLSLVLVLGVALPGTLATSTDITGSDSEFSIGTGTMEITEQDSATPLEDAENKTDEIPVAEDGSVIDTPACTCGTEDGTHVDGCPLYVAPAAPSCSCGTEDGTHVEGCPLYVAPADPVCSCGAEDGTHAEGCPLYVAPVDPVCTCGAENDVHAEDCPLYAPPVEPVLPEEPTHIDTCVEGCTGENCACPCHELSLFERLMACETLDELFAIVDITPEEELMALTDEENAEIEAKIAALEGEPLPPVVLEEYENESVISEIIYPAVNFDNVAPFGDPVEG